MMYKRFNNIFIGMILVFIDLNIFIDILPDFIGYGFIMNGLNGLYSNTKNREFLKAVYCNIPLQFISFISIFFGVLQVNKITLYAIALQTVVQLLQVLSVYFMYSGILKIIDDEAYRNRLLSFRNNYTIIFLLFSFVLTFLINMNQDMMLFIGIILVFVSVGMTLALIVSIRNIRNYMIIGEENYD